MPSYNHKTAITEAWWSLLHSLREPLQVVMSSKRTRDQTSPMGSTPYALSKRAPRDATDLQTPSTSDARSTRPEASVRKSLFQPQPWLKHEEKLLVTFVSLQCLDLDSAWPKYGCSHPLWEDASKFLSQHGDYSRTGIFVCSMKIINNNLYTVEPVLSGHLRCTQIVAAYSR